MLNMNWFRYSVVYSRTNCCTSIDKLDVAVALTMYSKYTCARSHVCTCAHTLTHARFSSRQILGNKNHSFLLGLVSPIWGTWTLKHPDGMV